MEDLHIVGGRENAIDICRGAYAHITRCTLVNNGSAALVAKGAFKCLVIAQCIFSGKGWDIELGQFDNYWKPGRKATGTVSILNCRRIDGKPLSVICWDADTPLVVGDAHVVKVPKVLWFPYFLFRYTLSKLKGTFK